MGIPIIGDIITSVKDLASELIVDKDKKMEFDYKLKQLEDQAEARADAQILGQIEVNKVEAANSSMFVAGWRPFIGWIGGGGLAMQAIILPLTSMFTGKVYTMNTELLMALVVPMLGLGAMRSYEKSKGVATNGYEIQPTATTTGSSNVEVDTKKGTVSVETTPSKPVTPAAAPKKKWHL